jgi:pilus assembly protein CpaE
VRKMAKDIFHVKLAAADPNIARMLSDLLRSTKFFEVVDLSDHRKADLLIFQLSENAAADLQQALAAVQNKEANEVFLVSETADSKILMQAMRAGVKEFFTQPLNLVEIKEALERFKERQSQSEPLPESKKGSIISVFGSKGGVGTTTVSVNLAVSLSQGEPKKSVALLDMNTLFGEIPLFLEMAPKFHWGEITKNIDRLDNTFLKNILTQHKSGVQVLPSPAYLNGHVRPTPDIMSRLLALMKQMFDYIIIDAGQSTDDTSIKVLEVSDMLMLITILSLPCLANTNKLLRSLTEMGYVPKDKINVVLNRYIKKGEISLGDAEAGIGKELFWVVPNDYDTSMSAINSGKPLLKVAPGAAITKSFVDMAKSLNDPEAGTWKKKRTLF